MENKVLSCPFGPRVPYPPTGPVTWEGLTGVQKATGPWKSHTLSYFYLVYFFFRLRAEYESHSQST